MTYRTFLVELFPRLEAVRRIERELDRKIAHRFNVLDYLRQDELGLSRVIADLLDPEARHGQGALFLETLLELDGVREVVGWPNLDSCRIAVATERKTDAGRSIDISVEIVDAEDTRYCLAIENKPYAVDQPKQVLDYMEFLECKYPGRFLLIYLSPTGEGPSEHSIDMESLREQKEPNRRFAIMAYSAPPARRHDEFEEFRIPCTLADWLRKCRNLCDADRLRWFLGDAEKFCKQTFGDGTMSSDIESKAILEFVLSDRRNLESAFAVYKAWSLVRDDICRRYLEKLCSHIRVAVKEDESLGKFIDGPDGLRVEYTYGAAAYDSHILLYRRSWVEYCIEESSRTLGESRTRTAIAMNNASHGPSNWGAGVASPISRDKMRPDDRERRDLLAEKLAGKGRTAYWPWWELLDKGKEDWSSRILDLQEESERSTENGEHGLTAYFVGKFVSIAKRAMPIIDEVEGRATRGGA